MKTIHKAKLIMTEIQRVDMPKGAVIRSIQIQGVDICVWFECNTEQPHECRKIVIVGTGHEVHSKCDIYLATVQIGAFVWHFYEALS